MTNTNNNAAKQVLRRLESAIRFVAREAQENKGSLYGDRQAANLQDLQLRLQAAKLLLWEC